MTHKQPAFVKGDWVSISKHPQEPNAIILKDGGTPNPGFSYEVFRKGRGSYAWVYEEYVTLIEPRRLDLLAEWQKELDEWQAKVSNLDWVFANGAEVLEKKHIGSVAALVKPIGWNENTLWGPNGEGFVLVERCAMVLTAARPYLESGDKDGWLTHLTARTA